MKRILLLAVIAITVSVALYLLYQTNEPDTNLTGSLEQSPEQSFTGVARDAQFGYEFYYPQDEDGYVTLENTESEAEAFVTGLTLIDRDDYVELQASTDAREGPPTITLRVYNNDENLSAAVFAMRHPHETNYEMMLGEEQETVVGGANAVRYIADGLYPIDTVVVANGDHVYVLTGAYLEPGDQYHEDFQAIVENFTFIDNTPTMGAKIDPRVACESALAYMLFETSEAADEFVEACIAGEHPDVIERYIEEQELNGASV